MEMDVLFDSCSGGFAQVHADVQSLRLVDFFDYAFGGASKGHHFLDGLLVYLLQASGVLIRRDHDVTAGVRIAVEDDEVEAGAMDNEHFFVTAESSGFAEDAFHAMGFLVIDVGGAPRRPEVLHFELSEQREKGTVPFLAVGGSVIDHGNGFMVDWFFATVYEIAQFFAGLKERDALRRHIDTRARFGITPDTRLSLTRAEAAESADLDFVTFVKAVDDAVEDGFHDGFGILAGHLDNFRHFFDELSLGHILSLFICTGFLLNPFSLATCLPIGAA